MNATPAVSRAPITADPSQAGGATSSESARPSANSQDFASALCEASPKPARKPATSKARDGGQAGGPACGQAGGPLPVPGNPSPPPTPPAAPGNPTAPSAVAGPAGSVAGTQGMASGAASATPPGAVRSAAPGATVIPGAPAKTALLNSDGAPLEAPPAAGAAAAESAGVGMVQGPALPGAPTASPTATAPAPGAPSASGAATAPGTGTRGVAAKPAGLAGARGAAGSAVKPFTAATTGPAADGDSTTTNKSGVAASTEATASTDATAQMPPAAALALAGAGAVAASGAGISDAGDASAPSTDDSAAPAILGMAQDAGNSTGLPAPAIAVAVAAGRGVAAAAGTVMNERETAALANAGTADKHSQGGIGGAVLADGSGNAGAGAALMNGTPPAAIDANPTPTMKVAAGVETPEFAQGIADRVSWMVDSNLNGAKLQVNPPQLGPIEVRITVQGDNAQIWMTSHSAVTREALEAGSPKLREMLGAQGFGQVSVDISQRSFQERPSQSQPYDWAPSANRPAVTAPVAATAAAIRRIPNGAVDAYA